MGVIEDELQEIQKLCEHVIADSKLISCVHSLVRVEIRKSLVKCITVCFQFPAEYPNCSILLELKSKHLSESLLRKLTQSCEAELKQLVGKPQILKTLKFLENYLVDYPLLCCYDEINEIKAELKREDEIKLNQKSSLISLKLAQNKYYTRAKLQVPQDYPDDCISVDVESNFPRVLTRYLEGQSKEVSRQCVEPPLNHKKTKEFKVKPSLLPIARLLISSTRHFVLQFCPVCNLTCLPDNPEDVVRDESHVERVYCGHLYHLKCLLTYLKTPPFKGGKKCINCSEKIHHEKWKVGDKLAEDRWAHKQARQRELQEVVDFLN